ncbi:YbfB/YjiJ family MFS transporter [Caballeronia sordidicola]|uniref:Permeases of the major facilitator superfamily n=1 Tax=Caballeronia sordidicola TaxID=196367 RepID=A0A242M579_CABSO|nr:YbfB/YjiJ family MFS transporter [Caballeronia sordidicola]OTP65993.1 Permeases of the major facilitator superfamily [Caballeronia sordidicola]
MIDEPRNTAAPYFPASDTAHSRRTTLVLAVGLSFGTAIALGLTRFSYALLLPAMKADLGWSFAQAGAMNTANALGYLLGALTFPLLARRWPAGVCFIWGCMLTAVLMIAGGLVSDTHALLVQRVVTGMTSASVFVGGSVLAARLASAHPHDAGFVLGLYYGGAGLGIIAAALLVPVTVLPGVHGWQWAWFALAAACGLASVAAIMAARKTGIHEAAPVAANLQSAARLPLTRLGFMLAGYGLFGVGYIGYMTFLIALLRSSGMSSAVVTAFYVLLGVATIGSARIWSGLLNRMRGGQALAVFNGVLAFATILPAVFAQPVVAFVSGALFGATFLSAVASTTAFVRHNLPAAQWTRGIGAFTIVFAFGQIVGPVVIGWISDGAGLARGLMYSSAMLAVGAVLAALQKPLASTRT